MVIFYAKMCYLNVKDLFQKSKMIIYRFEVILSIHLNKNIKTLDASVKVNAKITSLGK